MIASRNNNQAKEPDGRRPERGDSTPDRKTSSEENPVWRSLAMRSGILQTKLTIGKADDQYEREADRVADQVMRMPAPQSDGHALSITPVTSRQAQRKCAECEEEEEEKGVLRRKESGGAEAPATAPPIVHDTLSSAGQPLDTHTRAFFESRFGSDFSEVRVHDDAKAAESARAVNALAFTVEHHVVFGAERYSPGTERGNRLLAHELAHVVQQNGRRDVAESGLAPGTRAQPDTLQRQGVDVEDLDSDEFLQERPPNFTGVAVGSWGQLFPAQLVADERKDISFPETDHARTIDLATALREPCVIMREYHRLWIYKLKWVGPSARYSRFTNASTILFLASPEQVEGGIYSVSNVTGHPDVEAFVTEDGGVLLPPGAGKWFFHTGGEFEETAVSFAQNTRAFIQGLMKGLSDANFAELAKRLAGMAALNAAFPAPFTVGALHGVANELVGLKDLLDPRQWQAMEAAVQETVLMLSDPDGEELAALLGEEVGRAQAASLDQLSNKGPVTFAYEVGKIVGPTIIEMLLGFFGIEVGPLTLIKRAVDLLKKAPRLARITAEFADVFDLPGSARPDVDTPHLPHAGIEEGAPVSAGHPAVPSPRAMENLPELSPDEKALLQMTGDRNLYPDKLPEDLAAKELDIVKRAKPTEIDDAGDGYILEVDLGNGHQWQWNKNSRRWCRFSRKPTNCTPTGTEAPKPEPIEPTPSIKPTEPVSAPEMAGEIQAPVSPEEITTQPPVSPEEITTQPHRTEGEIPTEDSAGLTEPARLSETSPQELRAARQEEADLLESRADPKRHFDRTNEDIEQLVDSIAELESERDEILSKSSLTADDERQLRRLSNLLERDKRSLEAKQHSLATYRAEIDVIDNRLREIEVIKEEYRGAKPWRGEEGLSLSDPDVSRVGLYGELEVASAMQSAGFNPLGKTVRPDEIALPEDLEEAFKNYRGQTGIDGVFSRTDAKTGEQEYWIVESKATGSPDPQDPTGTASLDTDTLSGHQMSDSWVLDRLDKAGLAGEDSAAILEALTDPNKVGNKVRKVYAQTDATGTRFFEIVDVNRETVRIGNEITL